MSATLPRERGAAVVSALIIVAIVAALTTSLFQRQTASTRRIENEMARVQARMLLAGGIDWARLVVRDHGKRESTTRGDQIWATPVLDTRIERPGDDRVAVFSGKVQDEQGKYNLANLASNGVPQPEQEQVLRRTMTVLPSATSVNVNTAPPEVIAALVAGLSLSQARAITGERDRGNWFNNSGDFANRLAATGVKTPAPAVSTTSGWFLASGAVVYERARVSMQALIRSAPPAAPDTIWTRETP